LDTGDLTCEDAARLFDRLVEGGLGLDEEEVLKAHLAGCPACRAEYALDLALMESIRSAPEAAFESVAGAVTAQVRVRERRVWALRWGVAVAAVCAIAIATWQLGARISEPLLALLTGSFKSSPTYLALSKIGGLIMDCAGALKNMMVSGTMPGGLGSYAPQAAALVLIAAALALIMMYGMEKWLRKPVEVNSWRNG
jgi:anti-sigma factor RsiW